MSQTSTVSSLMDHILNSEISSFQWKTDPLFVPFRKVRFRTCNLHHTTQTPWCLSRDLIQPLHPVLILKYTIRYPKPKVIFTKVFPYENLLVTVITPHTSPYKSLDLSLYSIFLWHHRFYSLLHPDFPHPHRFSPIGESFNIFKSVRNESLPLYKTLHITIR